MSDSLPTSAQRNGGSARSTTATDITSAYCATAAHIGSWIIVVAIVFRMLGKEAYAMLTLVQATIGFLNYTALGLAPALVHLLARADAPRRQPPMDALSPAAPPVLDYEPADNTPSFRAVHSNGLAFVMFTGTVGLIATLIYTVSFDDLFRVPGELLSRMTMLVLLVGLGTLLHIASDASAAVLQTRRRIALDNTLWASSEVVWAIITFAAIFFFDGHLIAVAYCYLASRLLLFAGRTAAAYTQTGLLLPDWQLVRWPVIRQLLGFGLLVVFAQLADLLYAPTDYILINKLIDPVAVAVYAPAVQIDAGLLLLVASLANVLFPKSAVAHAAGHYGTLRRYYLVGTLAGTAILAVGVTGVWLLSGLIFRAWFGDALPQTQAILSLVLVHTVIGGSSAVGRSILLGMGKVLPFTISVLVAGAANVILSYCFVVYGGLGLRGIVLGTITVVAVRCLLWMPWYVLRTIRRAQAAACG